MAKKPKHGGARPNTGPKPQGDPVEKIGLALRPEVIAKLDALCIAWDCGRSQAVTKLINGDPR